MKSILSIFFVLSFFTSFVSISAQENDSLFFYIDIPVTEYPFNWDTKYSAASMQQSVKLTKSFYYSTHYGLELLGRKHLGKHGKLISKVLMTVFDFAPLPLSNTWLHEESHRSILALHQIDSKNAHWSNAVKEVKDQDLIDLKSKSPESLVREATAGNEGNLEFVLSVEKDVFFQKTNTWNYGLYWGNYMVNSFYLFGSTKDSKMLINFKHGEDHNIDHRDANGFDPINATYDLFNPFHSYAERGIHPSGVGIDRYVEHKDLSSEAQKFLKRQFRLSFLNFADLNLFGIDELGKNIKYNISLRHHMTSFGHSVEGNVFFKMNEIGGFISPKIYKNRAAKFFGLDMELRYKWAMLRLAAWEQPENQLYADVEKKLGGLIGLNISPQIKNVSPYLNFTMKSQGWVAGNPYLKENISVDVGIKVHFQKK